MGNNKNKPATYTLDLRLKNDYYEMEGILPVYQCQYNVYVHELSIVWIQILDVLYYLEPWSLEFFQISITF